MEHLYLFYLFVTLLTGIISLGIVTFIYVKIKETAVEYYLGFYLAFTLVIVPNALLTYIEINMPPSNSGIGYALKYFFSEIAVFALMFSIPVFAHYLCTTPHARKKNTIFGGLAIVMAIAHQVLEYLDEPIEDYGDPIIDIVFMAVMVYPLFVGLSTFGKVQDPIKKRLLKKFLILSGSFLPGLFIDTVLSEFFPISIQIFPALYCGFSIVFTHHFLKYYTAHHIQEYSHASPQTIFERSTGSTPELSAAPVPETSSTNRHAEEIFKKYNISPREQEIVHLILQGCSNQKIGDTLFISLNTVKTHIRNIYGKFEVNSRYELMSLMKEEQETEQNS